MLMRCFSVQSFRSLSRDRIVSALESLIGDANVLHETDDLIPYNVDWKGVYKTRSKDSDDYSLVVTPKTHQNVVDIMKWCHEKRVSVCPQGGNTSLVGGSTPMFADELIISFSKMNKVPSLRNQ